MNNPPDLFDLPDGWYENEGPPVSRSLARLVAIRDRTCVASSTGRPEDLGDLDFDNEIWHGPAYSFARPGCFFSRHPMPEGGWRFDTWNFMGKLTWLATLYETEVKNSWLDKYELF